MLILSAKASVDDRVKGLSAGGDDYLTRPFAFSELLARVLALVRRATQPGREVVATARAIIDTSNLSARVPASAPFTTGLLLVTPTVRDCSQKLEIAPAVVEACIEVSK